MAAPLSLLSRSFRRPIFLVTSRLMSSKADTKPPLLRRLLMYLSTRYYDVEFMLDFEKKMRENTLIAKNKSDVEKKERYGPHVAAGYFILSLEGSFRYCGNPEWFHGKDINYDFKKYTDSPLEEIDLSYTRITRDGLKTFDEEMPLRTLSLRGCPEVDDWCLSRLHVYGDSLEELDISHCPKITPGGLAALRNLKGLRHLDISSLPALSNPGLMVILLEEMLPKCHVTANGYDFDLPEKQEDGPKEEIQLSKMRTFKV